MVRNEKMGRNRGRVVSVVCGLWCSFGFEEGRGQGVKCRRETSEGRLDYQGNAASRHGKGGATTSVGKIDWGSVWIVLCGPVFMLHALQVPTRKYLGSRLPR